MFLQAFTIVINEKYRQPYIVLYTEDASPGTVNHATSQA